MPDEINDNISETQAISSIFGAIAVLSVVGFLKSRKTLQTLRTLVRAHYMPPNVVTAPSYNGNGKLPPAPVHPPSSVYVQISLASASVDAGDTIKIAAKYTYTIAGVQQPSVALPVKTFTSADNTWWIYLPIAAPADWDSLIVSGNAVVKEGPIVKPPVDFSHTVFNNLP